MLMKMLEDYLQKERKGFLDEKTRFVHSGRKDRIPKSLAKLITEVEEETLHQSQHSGTGQAPDPHRFTLNLAVDYGGMDEVARAAQRCQSTNQPINQSTLREHMDHPELPDIDLVIRTSGEMRTSNFFLWQTAYAEWEFTEKLFPDFTVDDLQKSVDAFLKRTRRFGS